MTIKIGIWGSEYWSNLRDGTWQDCLTLVKKQIEQALEDAGYGSNMSVTAHTGANPSVPNPSTIYDNEGCNDENLQAWDSWLDNNNAYEEDSNILLLDATGGCTVSSSQDGSQTSGCLTLGAGESLDSSNSVKWYGRASHYHDVYNILHELSHALDAPTGTEPIGDCVHLSDGYVQRTPTNTKFEQYNNCDDWIESNGSPNEWQLHYTPCASGELTDQSR